jgi:tRNA nucleotidyltransferase/poly(A) polymerase
MSEVKLYEVGGCVRDALLDLPCKDIDFVAVAPSFDALREHVLSEGFKVFVEKPEFGTLRVSVPKDHPLRAVVKDADFVLARKDGPSSDGRRPDFVEPGTLEEDLARRDFTVNAMARDPLDPEADLVDPFNGQGDLREKVLRFVGHPEKRISEDGLRVLRAFRFEVTKGLRPADATYFWTRTQLASKMLMCVSVERVREELEKMFKHDTVRSMRLLSDLPDHLTDAMFREGLRLSACLRK